MTNKESMNDIITVSCIRYVASLVLLVILTRQYNYMFYMLRFNSFFVDSKEATASCDLASISGNALRNTPKALITHTVPCCVASSPFPFPCATSTTNVNVRQPQNVALHFEVRFFVSIME